MTAAILAIFCATWPAALPRQIERAAHAAGVPSELFAATVGAESTCRPDVKSRKGAIGYGQILPGGSAAKGHTAKQLRRVRLNLRLAAEHLSRCIDTCGTWAAAVSMYAGAQGCVEGPWGQRVAGAAMGQRIAMGERR